MRYLTVFSLLGLIACCYGIISKNMAAVWTNETIQLLIEIWADEELQDMLDGSPNRNRDIYAVMAEKLNKSTDGIGQWTWKQCRDKIKNLKNTYKTAKKIANTSGSGRPAFRYYDAMDAILACRPSTEPVCVMDTSASISACQDEESSDDEIENHEQQQNPNTSRKQKRNNDLKDQENRKRRIVEADNEIENHEQQQNPNTSRKPQRNNDMKDQENRKRRIVEADNEKENHEQQQNPNTSRKPQRNNSTCLQQNDNLQDQRENESKPESENTEPTNPAKGKGESAYVGKGKLPRPSFSIIKKKKNDTMKDFLEFFGKMEETQAKRMEEMEFRLKKEESEKQREFEERMLQFELKHQKSMREDDKAFQSQMLAMQREMFTNFSKISSQNDSVNKNVTFMNQLEGGFIRDEQYSYHHL